MGSQTQFGTGTIRKISFLKAVGIAVLAALFCVGCAEKVPDGEGADGDGDKKVVDSAYTKHIIEFDPNGGTVTPTSATTGTNGRLYDLPTPEKDGYSFNAWFTAETGGDTVTTSTVFSKDTTIYAQWTLNKYTVKFVDYNETVIKLDTVNYNTGATAPASPIRTGYTFKNWDKAFSAVTDTLTVKAVYEINKYTIKFDANGGTVTPDTGTTGDGWKLDPLPEPIRTGYTFNGWFTAATGGIAVTEDSVFSKDTTIYAQWIPVFTDIRDGKVYKKVTIGTQTWMTENLNYNATGSMCYNNSADSCSKYGRLYNWATAMGIDAIYNNNYWNGSDVNHRGVCPVGWHVPSNAEWDTLMAAVGGSSTAGTKLKSSTGWYSYSGIPAGTDDYGFSALPGGIGYSTDNLTTNAGAYGHWWSSLDGGGVLACHRDMGFLNEYVVRNCGSKAYLYSVRCVQD